MLTIQEPEVEEASEKKIFVALATKQTTSPKNINKEINNNNKKD